MWIEISCIVRSCETPSMNDDVPARDAEGRTSFCAEKTAQSLYAQLGSKHRAPRRRLAHQPRPPSLAPAAQWAPGPASFSRRRLRRTRGWTHMRISESQRFRGAGLPRARPRGSLRRALRRAGPLQVPAGGICTEEAALMPQ